MGNITQYELYKSNLVDALHCMFSLPTKKEESKTGKMEANDSPPKDDKIDESEIDACLFKYINFIDSVSSDSQRSLFKTLANSIKIYFGNKFSQELNAYHDGMNLAYDLKKYSKRNRLQLVYEPNIED